MTYGGGGIPVYWIVNIRERQLDVYTEPSGESTPTGYRRCEVLQTHRIAQKAKDGRLR